MTYTIHQQRSIACTTLTCALALMLLAYTPAFAQDCNNNGIDDACDISCGEPASPCDIPGCGMSEDCNANGVPDACDITSQTSFDCNSNGVPDECDVAPSFSEEQVSSTANDFVRSVFATDMDGDGDADVLFASFFLNKIGWYENIDGLGGLGPERLISTIPHLPEAAFPSDLDGDGDADVLSASLGGLIAWSENIDGLGNFGPLVTITDNAQGASDVLSADMDGDGDLDVVSGIGFDGIVAWYENTDGLGNFGTENIITTEAEFVNSIFAIDLDGDGDVDVLSASRADNKIAWYENIDGLGSFGPQQVITTSTDEAISVFAADIDGDGDADVLSASRLDNKIAWYENTNSIGSFGVQRVISTDADNAISVFSADLDADGDNDVLSASFEDNKIAWYENADGLGNFGPQVSISTDAVGAFSAYAADLDGDTNIDVLAGLGAGRMIVWYRNFRNDCNNNTIPDECEPDADNDGIPDDCDLPCNSLQLGDVDGSGTVNLADVGTFATAVLDPASLTGDPLCAADINRDDNINGADIQGFVDLVLAP